MVDLHLVGRRYWLGVRRWSSCWLRGTERSRGEGEEEEGTCGAKLLVLPNFLGLVELHVIVGGLGST